MKLCVFRTVPLSIIRSFSQYTQQMVYVIQVCGQLASRIRTELQFHPVYSEKLLIMDRGTVRNL